MPEPTVRWWLDCRLLLQPCTLTALDLEFSLALQNTFMLMFFATVGLAANYTQLIKGGAKVFVLSGRFRLASLSRMEV
ncbi:sodium/glutamate symporter [Vibrio chagasii]|nr:sodium/glutamate symporter [Vibrio chagasii]